MAERVQGWLKGRAYVELQGEPGGTGDEKFSPVKLDSALLNAASSTSWRRNSHWQHRSGTCVALLCTSRTAAGLLLLPCRGAAADLRTRDPAGHQDLEPA